MSIIIKGMNMPKSCGECRFNNGIMCYALPDYMDDIIREWKEKKSDCPLIEIDDDLLKKAESAYVLQEVRRGLK